MCQKDGWSIHKVECKYLKHVAPMILPDAARFLSRLIKVLGRGGYLTRSYYTKTKYRMFKDLMSRKTPNYLNGHCHCHCWFLDYPHLKNDQNRMDHLSSLYGVLSSYLRGETLPNISELMGMYGRVSNTTFKIRCNQQVTVILNN